MVTNEGEPRSSWEAVIYRSATDANFRQALLDNPAYVLAGLGLLGEGETAIVQEYDPKRKLLVLPPLVDASEAGIEAAARRYRRAPANEVGRNRASRHPYSQEPHATPLRGPAVAGVAQSTAHLA